MVEFNQVSQIAQDNAMMQAQQFVQTSTMMATPMMFF